MTELADALKSAQENEKVRCIVITGSEKAFAAGADIAMMRDKSFVDVFAGDLFTPETDQIMRVRKPIIAAVSGYCSNLLLLSVTMRNLHPAMLPFKPT